MVLLYRYKALSHNCLLLSVLLQTEVQHTFSQLTLIDSALTCAAWSSCRGIKHCVTIYSYCRCFSLRFTVFLQRYKALSHSWLLLLVIYLVLHGPLAEVQSTVSQLTLIVGALPCAAWSSCRGTKHCLTIDSNFQCFTLWCMVLLQSYKALPHNWLLKSVLYLVLHGLLMEVLRTLPIDSYFRSFTLCCSVLLQRYKALSHNWLLLSVLYLVLPGPLAELQITVSQLTLIVSALPCAAWSSCRGANHCLSIDSYC